MFPQAMRTSNFAWDEAVPAYFATRNFRSNLKDFQNYQLHRHIHKAGILQFHVFTDASENAYQIAI